MSRFSSFKKNQLLFEGWRKYANLTEAEDPSEDIEDRVMREGPAIQLADYIISGYQPYGGGDFKAHRDELASILEDFTDMVEAVNSFLESLPEQEPKDDMMEQEVGEKTKAAIEAIKNIEDPDEQAQFNAAMAMRMDKDDTMQEKIEKTSGGYYVTSKAGKKLSKKPHKTKKAALAQLGAVEASKAERKK